MISRERVMEIRAKSIGRKGGWNECWLTDDEMVALCDAAANWIALQEANRDLLLGGMSIIRIDPASVRIVAMEGE